MELSFADCIFILRDYNNSVSINCKVSTLLCYSYQKETNRKKGYHAASERTACPVETTLMLIGDKWKVLILRDLMPGTKRFGELKNPLEAYRRKC